MRRCSAFGTVLLTLAMLAILTSGCAAGDRRAAREAGASGTITAQPQSRDSATEFEVRRTAIAKWFSRITILLSDREGDPFSESGTFTVLAGDLEGDYHRVEITLAEMPTAPGEYPVTRLTYSVHDANVGPFNFGWSEVEGSVSISEVSGTAEAENGVVAGARVVGTFALTNNKGGQFSGSFVISPES